MNQSRYMVLIFSMLLLISKNNVNSYLGINWGRTATQRLLPSMVVDMILQNGISEVKIFAAPLNVLQAFIGTNIGLVVTIPNDALKDVNSVDDALKWIDFKLASSVEMGINLRYISIGTQAFSRNTVGQAYFHAAEVLDYMQKAIEQVPTWNNGKVKATIDHYVDVMTKVTKPSEAEFTEEVRDLMIRSTEILVKSNAPIGLNMFPIYSAKVLFNDTEFAYFDNNSTSKFMDGDYEYNNIFEVVYDMFVCALEKVGFPNVTIMVTQIGWPTDGIADGNATNAQRFNRELIKYIMSGKGTPRRPFPLDAYLHNLADENRLPLRKTESGDRGSFVRHWGVYKFDGKPKYHIDFSGNDRDIEPYSAKGMTHMPNRWCVFNRQSNDTTLLAKLFLDACKVCDCTSMDKGGSCTDLTFPEKVSYAFNMFFQEKAQKLTDSGCDFEGLGMITPIDPSVGRCTYPIEILSAEVKLGSRSPNLLFTPAIMIIIILSILFSLVHLLLLQ